MSTPITTSLVRVSMSPEDAAILAAITVLISVLLAL